MAALRTAALLLLAALLAVPAATAQFPNDGRPCGYTGDGHVIGDNVGRCADNLAAIVGCSSLSSCAIAITDLFLELVAAVECRVFGGC